MVRCLVDGGVTLGYKRCGEWRFATMTTCTAVCCMRRHDEGGQDAKYKRYT